MHTYNCGLNTSTYHFDGAGRLLTRYNALLEWFPISPGIAGIPSNLYGRGARNQALTI